MSFVLKIHLQVGGIKIPFGIHRKTTVRTVFVDHDLLQLEDPVSYFLHIEPMESERFLTLSQELEAYEGIEFKTDEYLNKSTEPPALQDHIRPGYRQAENLIHHGMDTSDITDKRRRHYYQMFVILYYKDQGCSVEQTTLKTIEWALNEKECKRSDSSIEEIKLDVVADVEHIYRKNKKFRVRSRGNIVVSRRDIELINASWDEPTKRIAWCILLLGYMFHKDGQFFFSIRQLEKMTGCSRNTVDRRVKWLRENDFMQRIHKGYFHSNKSSASTYYIASLVQSNSDSLLITLETAADTFTGLFEETYDLIEKIYKADQNSTAIRKSI